MTTGVVHAEMPVPISPQRPNAVRTAKEDAEAVMKLLNNRQRRKDKHKKRERDSDPQMKERELRLKQAQEDLELAQKQAPLVVDSSAFRADMDEIEPESEFNCFECQFAPSRRSSEKRLSDWMEADESKAAAPDLVADLREAPNPLDAFIFIANESRDLRLEGHIVPTPVCKLIFELVVYGEPVSSDAAWNLLNHLTHTPADVTFGDRLRNQAQPLADSRPGIACGLEWFPPDEFWVKALIALGYKPPGTRPAGDGQSRQVPSGHGTMVTVVASDAAAPAECFCTPAAFMRPPQHPWARRVQRLCSALALLEREYHKQHPGPDPAVPPPFGADPALAAMLCRTAADATLPKTRAEPAAAAAAYLSMHAPGDDVAWGRLFVAAVHDLRTALPSSQALVRVCRSLGGNARCGMLRQALAMVSLEAMHGGAEKVELTDVSSVAVMPVIEKLPDWRTMLRTMTPPGDEVPFGWEVLSTAEFIHMLVEPAVAQQLQDARTGKCPTDTITRTVVPLLDGLAKGLKNRRTVSVFRTRLFCSSLCACYTDAVGALRAVAQAELSGQGPISLIASQ